MNEEPTQLQIALQRLVRDLLRDAREQKRRVRDRLRALRGDEVKTPSRGPIQKNGMRCIRWHYWTAARIKHREITDRITAVKSCLPNDQVEIPPNGGSESKKGVVGS